MQDRPTLYACRVHSNRNTIGGTEPIGPTNEIRVYLASEATKMDKCMLGDGLQRC